MCLFHAIDDIGRDAREVIRNLNGSLGFRHFHHIMNERTGFASCASAFESAFGH